MGIESIAPVKSCVILHVFATAKCGKMQVLGGCLSRFVTRSGYGSDRKSFTLKMNPHALRPLCMLDCPTVPSLFDKIPQLHFS